jgi:hypothetical protein
MVSPLLVVVLRVPQIAFDLLIPLLLLEEAQSCLVLLGRPLGEAELRLALGMGGFFLKTRDALELLDGALDGSGLGLAFALDYLGKATGILLF